MDVTMRKAGWFTVSKKLSKLRKHGLNGSGCLYFEPFYLNWVIWWNSGKMTGILVFCGLVNDCQKLRSAASYRYIDGHVQLWVATLVYQKQHLEVRNRLQGQSASNTSVVTERTVDTEIIWFWVLTWAYYFFFELTLNSSFLDFLMVFMIFYWMNDSSTGKLFPRRERCGHWKIVSKSAVFESRNKRSEVLEPKFMRHDQGKMIELFIKFNHGVISFKDKPSTNWYSAQKRLMGIVRGITGIQQGTPLVPKWRVLLMRQLEFGRLADCRMDVE